MQQAYYDEENGRGFLMGLFCGAAVGAALGLMFTPKSGREYRKQLYDSTDQWRQKAADMYGQASETVSKLMSEGQRVADRGREAFESVRKTATDFTEPYQSKQPM